MKKAIAFAEFEIPCTEDVPTCVDTCGKTLACGEHTCTQRCHIGPCGMVCRICFWFEVLSNFCLLGQFKNRAKSVKGIRDFIHLQCRQISVKRCRCGARTKELPCYKEYLCDTKCSKFKDCRKHQCKRKVQLRILFRRGPIFVMKCVLGTDVRDSYSAIFGERSKKKTKKNVLNFHLF